MTSYLEALREKTGSLLKQLITDSRLVDFMFDKLLRSSEFSVGVEDGIFYISAPAFELAVNPDRTVEIVLFRTDAGDTVPEEFAKFRFVRHEKGDPYMAEELTPWPYVGKRLHPDDAGRHASLHAFAKERDPDTYKKLRY